MTAARRHALGSLDLRRHAEKKAHSQADVISLWWITNSGWMLSEPGALPCLSLAIASLSSAGVKSPDRLALTLAALERLDTSWDVERANSLSASGKRPFFRSWAAMAFAVTGHLGGGVLLPESWFMVCHALRLEWVKSIDSTTSVHLALRVASSFSSSAVAVASTSALELACWWARRRWLHSSFQPGM
ncbi:unnamed protein product [Arctogadus glacialis]